MDWLKKIFTPSPSSVTHEVTDDSGFLAIIEPDAFRGFVHQQWTLDMLRRHFVQEMAERRLLIWSTGLENTWSIHVSSQPHDVSGFREISGTIASSRGRLLLTNYESLTMAAQFGDVVLPEPHEQANVLHLPAGLYDCRIVQLSDPDTSAPFEESVNFVCQFTPARSPATPWEQIPWGAP